MTVEIFTLDLVGTGTELDHFACSCDWDTAFCGSNLKVSDWTDRDEEWRLCVVCVDLSEHFQDVSLCCAKDPDVRHG